jgi:hypothetical protein
MPSGLAHPWPEYATAVVEIAAPKGRLLLRPESSGAADVSLSGGQRDLSEGLGVAAGTVVWIVTASNPYPTDLDETTNSSRAQQLEQELDRRGLVHLAALARSPDGSSQEVSRAVHGTTREAVLDVARRFGQLAVFEIADDIACVEAATGRVVTTRPYVVGPADA